MKIQGKITYIEPREGLNTKTKVPYYGANVTVLGPRVDSEPQQSFTTYIAGDADGKMLPPNIEVGSVVEADCFVTIKERRGQNGTWTYNDIEFRNIKVITPAKAEPF